MHKVYLSQRCTICRSWEFPTFSVRQHRKTSLFHPATRPFTSVQRAHRDVQRHVQHLWVTGGVPTTGVPRYAQNAQFGRFGPKYQTSDQRQICPNGPVPAAIMRLFCRFIKTVRSGTAVRDPRSVPRCRCPTGVQLSVVGRCRWSGLLVVGRCRSVSVSAPCRTTGVQSVRGTVHGPTSEPVAEGPFTGSGHGDALARAVSSPGKPTGDQATKPKKSQKRPNCTEWPQSSECTEWRSRRSSPAPCCPLKGAVDGPVVYYPFGVRRWVSGWRLMAACSSPSAVGRGYHCRLCHQTAPPPPAQGLGMFGKHSQTGHGLVRGVTEDQAPCLLPTAFGLPASGLIRLRLSYTFRGRRPVYSRLRLSYTFRGRRPVLGYACLILSP